MADIMQTILNNDNELKVIPCSNKMAKYACEHYHYSKKMAAGKLICHGVYEYGSFIGAIVYSNGANYMINSPYALKSSEVCELSRVALTTHKNTVSKIISKSLKLLHKQFPDLKLVISYADPNQNHLGIIYQAGNWIYEGQKRNTYQYLLNGKLVHGRTVHKRYGTAKIKYLRENVDKNAKMIYIKGKFKYIYPMTKSIRKQFMRLHKPYPRWELMKRIVDLQITIDGLVLRGGETVDGFIEKIEQICDTEYEITCQVLNEELYNDPM